MGHTLCKREDRQDALSLVSSPCCLLAKVKPSKHLFFSVVNHTKMAEDCKRRTASPGSEDLPLCQQTRSEMALISRSHCKHPVLSATTQLMAMRLPKVNSSLTSSGRREVFRSGDAAWEGTAMHLVEAAWVTFWFATCLRELGEGASPMAEYFNPTIRRNGWSSHPLAQDLDLYSDHTPLVLKMLGCPLPIHCPFSVPSFQPFKGWYNDTILLSINRLFWDKG